MLIRRMLAVASSLLLLAGCSDPQTATMGGATVNLTGAYSSTNVIDSAGFTSMRWVLTQANQGVSGTITISGIAQTGTGTITGTLDGRTLTFTATIPAGGLAPGPSDCTATLSGTAENVTSTTISGTYSGNYSCRTAPAAGSMVLTRE